jgi:hypothetical protein
MLDFHHDPWLRVLWYTSASEPAKVRANPNLSPNPNPNPNTSASEPAKVREGSREEGGLKVRPHNLKQLGGLPAVAAAAVIRSERLGVIVDLDGWIGDDPPRALMAAHPAPVRAQWLQP